MSPIAFDQAVAETLLRYAKLIVARGYVHNSLGNLAIRVPHPDFPYGVAYTKHAEVSLEEMTLDHVVITDIPTPRLLHGTMPTSVGHNLNREILRLRPDVGAVIHVHHDETSRSSPPAPPRSCGCSRSSSHT
jgi:L-fuculose-phosphate aldolase